MRCFVNFFDNKNDENASRNLITEQFESTFELDSDRLIEWNFFYDI